MHGWRYILASGIFQVFLSYPKFISQSSCTSAQLTSYRAVYKSKMSADDTVGTKRDFADISKQQLETIVQDKDAKNTRRSTDQSVRLFRKYLQEKVLDPAFESYDKQTLDNKLC